MMHAYRLVRLIEAHSDALANSLLEKVQQSSSTLNYCHRVPPDELRQRVHEVYAHLGEWLLRKEDTGLERRYREIGARRYRQQVPLAELIWVIVLTKETLWQYVSWETVPDRPVEVFGEIELVNLVGQFFDSAIYFATAGYDEARVADQLAPSGC
jgi:hypothetical protein